jgi:3-oxoacyl-[acyl-carrier protein] reductase
MAGPNAQLRPTKTFWEEDPSEWDKYIRTNLHGVMNCCHAAIPAMIEAQRGRLVTIVSDSGRVGEPRQAVYSAAKAGAAGFVRSIAKEVGKYGVTCNAIALSSIQTMMTPEQFEAFQQTDQYKAQISRYPIRRWGMPEDVGALAAFLCSGAASWITGQTYPLNGGYSMAM